MEELETMIEETMEKIRFRDTIAAIAIASAFVAFGTMFLILIDVIPISLSLKTPMALMLLVITWILMSLGIYLLTSMPVPKLPRLVADSDGVEGLMRRGYDRVVYVSGETFKKLPPKITLKMNLKVIEIDDIEVEKYRKHGEELSYAIAIAKKLKARVVSSKRGKVDGVEIITAKDV
ncbi:MAG: hypothetical protein RMH75_02090 [Archaeoglobaceae archaeon]|nr:hypothetical protein [Archaeoglobaceae archaeon]MDW7989447.1 hypothetical protein [Archaeoglobaceae archaeon]